jgi:hypothetical protein
VPGSLIVVHVHARVLPDAVEAFRAASIANARESLREPGVARFDVVQSTEDPTRSCSWRSSHRRRPPRTRRRRTTRDGGRVADLMAEPRTVVRYVNVAPKIPAGDADERRRLSARSLRRASRPAPAR